MKKEYLIKLRSLYKELKAKINEFSKTIQQSLDDDKQKILEAIKVEIKACKKINSDLVNDAESRKRKLSDAFNRETVGCDDDEFKEKNSIHTAQMNDIDSDLRLQRRKISNLIVHLENNKTRCENDYKMYCDELKKEKKDAEDRINIGFDTCEKTIIDYQGQLQSKKNDHDSKISSKSEKSKTKKSTATSKKSSSKLPTLSEKETKQQGKLK